MTETFEGADFKGFDDLPADPLESGPAQSALRANLKKASAETWSSSTGYALAKNAVRLDAEIAFQGRRSPT